MNINDLKTHAYAPYSGSPLGAVVQSSEGAFFPGCLIENIAYPLTITAEQNALFCCLSEGHTPQKLWTMNTDQNMLAFWEDELGIEIQAFDKEVLGDLDFHDVKLDPELNPPSTLINLLDQALVAQSNFPVSALVETENGFFGGVNIECSAWNMGLCAERVAIAKALTYGEKEIKSLHIHSRDGEFSSPCGACRQVIFEHLPNRQIHLHHADHSKSIHFSNDLLPHSFRSTSLSN